MTYATIASSNKMTTGDPPNYWGYGDNWGWHEYPKQINYADIYFNPIVYSSNNTVRPEIKYERCKYCRTKAFPDEKHCCSCGAPL